MTDVLNELFGLGPLEALLRDPAVSDILVNRHDSIFVEREGKLEETDIVFKDDRHLLQIIERIVSSVGRRIDESSPMVDARLQDGSRVNAIIAPLALDGPALSIRRFRTDRLGADDLVDRELLTQPMLDFLKAAVACRLNIIVSGGTGAGKTTLLNILSSFIGQTERVVTIEDAAELMLRQRHVVRLETRPANITRLSAFRRADADWLRQRHRPRGRTGRLRSGTDPARPILNMEFDWLDAPFDLKKVSPKEIEESFEDPFSLRLLPDGVENDAKARYFNLGKSIGDRGIFTVFWSDGKRYRAILAREMTPEEHTFYEQQDQPERRRQEGRRIARPIHLHLGPVRFGGTGRISGVKETVHSSIAAGRRRPPTGWIVRLSACDGVWIADEACRGQRCGVRCILFLATKHP